MESKIKLGKEYNFVGCRWVPVKFIDEEKQIVVMQSLGVTVGPWPGFSMGKFGNGDYYNRDITRRNISDYDDKTRVLMEQIRPIVSGDAGLYLPSYDSIKTNSVWRNALAKAAANYRSFGASYHCAWTGTYGGSSNYAWIVDSDGCTYNNGQSGSYVIPAAFDLNLSKIEIEGDEIIVKGVHDDSDHTQKNTVRMRVMAVRYGYAVVEAESEEDAIELANNLPDSQFDWSDPDDIQVVDDNIDE